MEADVVEEPLPHQQDPSSADVDTDETDDLADVEFMLEEIEDKIAPLVLVA